MATVRESGYGHPICINHVRVPTIQVVPTGEGYPEAPPECKTGEEVIVQWWGFSEKDETVLDKQFRFPITRNPGWSHWKGHPELFRVVYLGAASDWPNPNQLDIIINEVASGNERLPVLYMVTSHYGIDDGSLEVTMPGFNLTVVPLITLCNDLIVPGFYYEPRVIEQERGKLSMLAAHGSLALF